MLKFSPILQETPKETSVGIVLLSGDRSQVLVVYPTGGFGGYEFTFPKGHLGRGEDKWTCAKREFEEETGLPSSILKSLSWLGPFSGTTTVTSYMLCDIEGPDDIVDRAKPPINPELGFPETQKVEWFTFEEFEKRTRSRRDKEIIQQVQELLRS